jgi:hypothetical protein
VPLPSLQAKPRPEPISDFISFTGDAPQSLTSDADAAAQSPPHQSAGSALIAAAPCAESLRRRGAPFKAAVDTAVPCLLRAAPLPATQSAAQLLEASPPHLHLSMPALQSKETKEEGLLHRRRKMKKLQSERDHGI